MLSDDSSHKKRHGAKAGVDLDKATQRRSEQAVSLRNKHRLEALMQKRVVNADFGELASPAAAMAGGDADRQRALSLLFADDQASILQGAIQLRCIVCDDIAAAAAGPSGGQPTTANPTTMMHAPVIDMLAATPNVFERIIALLQHPLEEVRLNIAAVVTNVACSSDEVVQRLLNLGGGIQCGQLLAPEQPERIREQMAWAVANMAGSGRLARDNLLAGGALNCVLQALENPNNALGTLRNLTWAMGNLCRHKPPPPLIAVQAVLPACYHLLQHPDTSVQDAACWAVSYISDGAAERINACQDAGLIPIVFELLRTQRSTVMLPAIRVFGNYAVTSSDMTQRVVEMGVLPLFQPLMQPHVERLIRKECCWTLSNVAAGRVDQVQIVLDSGLMPLVVRCMSDPELEVRKEAAWVCANIAAAGTQQQTKYMTETFDVLPPLTELLRTHDAKICSVTLEALEAILHVGKAIANLRDSNGINPYARVVEELDGVALLSDLETHTNGVVAHRARNVMMDFFDDMYSNFDMGPPTAGYTFTAPGGMPAGFGGFGGNDGAGGDHISF
jgi:hypothetical protein